LVEQPFNDQPFNDRRTKFSRCARLNSTCARPDCSAYDGGGIKALKPKPIGGRQRENMTVAEEKALLGRFGKAAGAGEMLNIHDLKAAYDQAIGHSTSNSTIYKSFGPAWLAQTDATSVSSPARPRGTERF
jgi:hypothetical protein